MCARPNQQRRRLVYVESAATVHSPTAQALGDALGPDFQLVTVADVAEAVQTLRDRPCDAALMRVPSHGRRRLAALRSLVRQAPDLPVVVLTPPDDDQLNRRLRRVDLAGRHIETAHTPDSIRRSVCNVVRRRADRNRSRFHSLAAHLTDVFRVVDPTRREIRYINAAYEPIWGRSRRALRQDPDQWLEAVHADDRPSMRDWFWGEQIAGESDRRTFRVVRPDGEVRWIEDRRWTLPGNAAGEVWSAGLSRDITELRCVQRQAERDREQMTRMDRANQLGKVTLGIVHELTQPLSAIISCSGAAAEMIRRSPCPDEIADLIEQLTGEATRAGQIIRRLRRVLAHNMPQRSTVDAESIVRRAAELVQPRLTAECIQLVTTVDEDLPPLRVDEIQIEQVLANLIQNAADAIVAVPEGPARIEVCVRQAAHRRIRFDVIDSGPGADQQTLDRMFDFQFTTKPGGMGVGLPISRAIIRAHDGEMTGRPNDTAPGLTMTFTLPHE